MEATQIYAQQPGYFKRLNAFDWLFSLALFAGALVAFNRFGAYMDVYEKAILLASAPAFSALGWYWKPLRWLMPLCFLLALCAVSLYGGQLAAADQRFWLKYMLSSQSAILWMSTLFFLSTLLFWGGLLTRSTLGGVAGSLLCWGAVVLGVTGMLVRWYESYLIGTDIGHIPISNLYEVFILFSLITAMFYLYYEEHYATRALGQISMKVGALVALFAVTNLVRGKFVDRLPSGEVLEDVMYKAISIGFAFFTIATILGALWAAEAWGGYWSWDPKETWALIVWLNYAAWLHMRLMSGLRGKAAAWWAVVGLVVTTFAFLGVNMFLSGLHSYGKL